MSGLDLGSGALALVAAPTAELVAVLVAVLSAAVVAGELVARAALRRGGYYVWQRYFRRELELERETFPQLEHKVTWSINSDGERGGECPAGPGVFRILFAGASVTECALVDQESTWPARIERFLSEPVQLRRLGARHVHVGNIARSSMDMRAVDLILQRVLPRYRRLDAVCLMVGPGDCLRFVQAGAPSSAAAPAVPVEACFDEHPEMRFGWHPRSAALREVVKRLVHRLHRPVERRSGVGQSVARARSLRQKATEVRTAAPDARVALDCFEHHLRSGIARARAAARHVVLLRQPTFRKTSYTPEEEALLWTGGVGYSWRGDDVTVFYSSAAMSALYDQADARMASVAAELNVPLLDAAPALAMDAVTFYDDLHLTAAGSSTFAEAVAAGLINLFDERRKSPRPGTAPAVRSSVPMAREENTAKVA